jgi:hypothetical protein
LLAEGVEDAIQKVKNEIKNFEDSSSRSDELKNYAIPFRTYVISVCEIKDEEAYRKGVCYCYLKIDGR